MLYDRWRSLVRERPRELALCDLPSGRRWTFAELDRAVATVPPSPTLVCPHGAGPDFILQVLQAWRDDAVTCPLEGAAAPPEPGPLPAQVVHLKMTSATTGAARLVAFTAAQLAADADSIVATMGLRPDWPNLAVISLAHSYGFSNLVTPLLLHGIPLLLGGAPLPEVVRQAGSAFPHLTLPAVPALWRAWHEADALPPSLRLAISAGAPLPLPLEQDIFTRRGIKVHNFYGTTECGGIAYDRTEVPRTDPAVAGSALVQVHLSVNDRGCLEVRGPAVGEGYWPQPDCTLGDAVHVTSDLAELRHGTVCLRGRATDVINVAGRKLAPETIEVALAEHPAVRACLVFGVPSADADRAEAVVACVEAREEISGAALRQFLLGRLESWQVPRDIWFVESLAANARGKTPRAHWRQHYLQASTSGDRP